MSFKLGTFSIDGSDPLPGLVLDQSGYGARVGQRGNPRIIMLHDIESLLDASGHALPAGVSASMLVLLEHWDASLLALVHASACLKRQILRQSLPLNVARIHAPVTSPRQVFCTIANYRSQILEALAHAGKAAPQQEVLHMADFSGTNKIFEERMRTPPYVCVKLPSAVTGPCEALEIPDYCERLDWELELGAVIGRPCYRVPRAAAMDYVAGYMLVNDITARDRVRRPDLPRLATDWLQSKCGPGFLPTGPYLVPARFVPDPYSLRLRLSLNGQTMQDAPASDMLFDLGQQIEHISTHARLLPGDIICTGTPAGSGVHHGRFLQPGDIMQAQSPVLGVQQTRCIRPAG